MEWISEIDQAKNDSKLSSSLFGRMLPDFEALDSEIASALKKLLTAGFKRRFYMEAQKGTTGQSIPERKTNCLDDL